MVDERKTENEMKTILTMESGRMNLKKLEICSRGGRQIIPTFRMYLKSLIAIPLKKDKKRCVQVTGASERKGGIVRDAWC